LTKGTARITSARDERVVIVGGGAIGVCCAYFLANAGVRVLLLEENEICSGCSFGNLGLLAASHCAPLASPGVISKALHWMLRRESPFSIHWRADPQLAAWLWRFFRASRPAGAPAATAALLNMVLASMAIFEDLSGMGDLTFGFEKRGVLELFATTQGFAEAHARAQSLRNAGLKVEVLDARAAKTSEPMAAPGIRGGMLCLDDGHILPANFVRGLALLAGRAGAELREHAAIVDFKTVGNRVTGVTTAESVFPVSAVILAAGSASPNLARKLGIHLPVQPARGYSFTRPAHGWRPFRPIMFSESKALLTPMGNDLRLGGVLELTGMDSPVDIGRARALVKSSQQYLRPEISFDGIEPWSGYRPCSPDGFPIVGWSQRCSNLLYVTGHGMLGLTLAPLSGQIVADLVRGKEPRQDVARLRPSRFGNAL
jgi:D-amino-acid dehydrogenase